MSKASIKIEFDFYEEREEIQRMLDYQNAYSKLFDIYHIVREELKHSDEDHSENIERILEQIKELAYFD